MVSTEPGSAIRIDPHAQAALDQFMAEAEEDPTDDDPKRFLTAMEKAYRCGYVHAQHREQAPGSWREGDPAWRVGQRLGRTLYHFGKVAGLVDTAALAAELVDAANAMEERALAGATPGGAKPVDGERLLADAEATWGRLSWMERTEEEEREMSVARDIVMKADAARQVAVVLPAPSEPVRCLDTPEVDGWAVNVIHHPGGVCKTVFSVGVQHFILATDGGEYAEEFCTFIRDTFLRALATLGVDDQAVGVRDPRRADGPDAGRTSLADDGGPDGRIATDGGPLAEGAASRAGHPIVARGEDDVVRVAEAAERTRIVTFLRGREKHYRKREADEANPERAEFFARIAVILGCDVDDIEAGEHAA